MLQLSEKIGESSSIAIPRLPGKFARILLLTSKTEGKKIRVKDVIFSVIICTLAQTGVDMPTNNDRRAENMADNTISNHHIHYFG
jgi:hypothetical protein